MTTKKEKKPKKTAIQLAEEAAAERAVILATIGEFTWLWDRHFFVETKDANYIWSDPRYDHGDNTLKPTTLSYSEFCRERKIEFGRSKGKHRIGDYCGANVVIVK